MVGFTIGEDVPPPSNFILPAFANTAEALRSGGEALGFPDPASIMTGLPPVSATESGPLLFSPEFLR